MPRTVTLQVTLSDEELRFVEGKVASGEYASVSDVLAGAVASLQDQQAGFEHWIRTEGLNAYRDIKASPSKGLSVEDVERHFEDKALRSLKERA